jgi:hypothetical protein
LAARQRTDTPPLDEPDRRSISTAPSAAPGIESEHRDTRTDRDVAVQPNGSDAARRAPPPSRTDPSPPPARVNVAPAAERAELGSGLGLPMPPGTGVRLDAEPAARPTVHVTIGRIEVRAVHLPPAPPVNRPPAGARLSLDDYLRERNGGRP